MFQSKTTDVVNQLVEAMLSMSKCVGTEVKVIFVSICLEAGKSSDDQKLLRRYVHLMYYAPASYVLVGVQASDTSVIPNQHEWEYRVNHDSCWRNDGTERVLWDAYLSMCNEVDSSVAPAALYTSADIHSIQFHNVTAMYARKNDPIRLKF